MSHSEHNVFDRDAQFIVDVSTRTISQTPLSTSFLMQYDHNSERITFEMSRMIEEHDMSECDRVEVHYINIGANGKRNVGVYEVEDLTVGTEDDQIIRFTWLISQNATSLAGSLSFLLRFMCTSDGEFDYVWSTAIHSSISIGTGMENAEIIATQYADILGQWYDEVEGKIATAKQDIIDNIDFEGLGNELLATANVYSKDEIDFLFSSYITDVDSVLGECVSFTIEGTAYRAEEGMTWTDWVDSAYNTGGFYLYTPSGSNNSYVLVATSTGTATVSEDGLAGIPASSLIEAKAYVLQYSDGQ